MRCLVIASRKPREATRKRIGYVRIVVARARGNVDGAMRRTLNESEFGARQKVLRKAQRGACSSHFRLAESFLSLLSIGVKKRLGSAAELRGR